MGETAKLPDGSMFEFWEDETVYDIVLHVNSTHPDVPTLCILLHGSGHAFQALPFPLLPVLF